MIIPSVKTAIFGSSGYLGREILFRYREYFPDCIATSRTPLDSRIQKYDITSDNIFKLKFKKTMHEQALILSSISKIATCEKKNKETYNINVAATLNLARQLSDMDIKPIFFSSDVVFDGKKGNYSEIDIKNPLNAYGKQKSEVEDKIADYTGGNY